MSMLHNDTIKTLTVFELKVYTAEFLFSLSFKLKTSLKIQQPNYKYKNIYINSSNKIIRNHN